MKKNILITGITSGIGKSLVDLLYDKYNVIGTCRNVNLYKSELINKKINIIPLDLSSYDSVDLFEARLRSILKDNKLFAIINNAGIVIPSSIFTYDRDAAETMLKINTIGTFYFTSKLIEYIEHKVGRIINIGSVSSRIVSPILAHYSASKASLSCFTKSWRMELKNVGIQVTQLDFGNVDTGLMDKTLPEIEKKMKEIPQYSGLIHRMKESAIKRKDAAISPEKAAQEIKRIMEKTELRHSYLIGKDAQILVFFLKILPYRKFEKLITKKLGLNK